MNHKLTIALIILIGLALGVYLISAGRQGGIVPNDGATTTDTALQRAQNLDDAISNADTGTAVAPGPYDVLTEKSTIAWSASKTNVAGYLVNGTVPISSGRIEIFSQVVDALVTLDVAGITVGENVKEPGTEGALSERLRGIDFFNTATNPTGELRIRTIMPRPDVPTTFMYDVTADVTLMGITNEVTFPAKVLITTDRNLLVRASMDIDRTVWGISFGSGTLAKDVAGDIIGDTVHLEVMLIAQPSSVPITPPAPLSGTTAPATTPDAPPAASSTRTQTGPASAGVGS